ncbi:MAG TPA: DNA repair protein RadC [Burkholderiales bacterium]|nr:DNA repair protein RadC [Burkholderiales bacterium]
MAITDWPEAERPRERLLAHGAAQLSDAELLAIFLRTGSRGQSALDLARALLGRFESLSAIIAQSPGELCTLPGLGEAKAAQLLAAVELTRRALGEKLAARHAMASPAAVRDYLRLSLSGREHEVFVAVMLDAQHRVIASEELFRGTLTQTSVYPREVVKCALRHNAAAVIFAHNHPSGAAEPSHADEMLTRSLKSALALVDVRVLDHFIVAGSEALSFAERGLL